MESRSRRRFVAPFRRPRVRPVRRRKKDAMVPTMTTILMVLMMRINPLRKKIPRRHPRRNLAGAVRRKSARHPRVSPPSRLSRRRRVRVPPASLMTIVCAWDTLSLNFAARKSRSLTLIGRTMMSRGPRQRTPKPRRRKSSDSMCPQLPFATSKRPAQSILASSLSRRPSTHPFPT